MSLSRALGAADRASDALSSVWREEKLLVLVCSWVGRKVASGSLQSCSKSCLSQEPNLGSVSEGAGAAGAGWDRDPLGLVCLLGKVGLPARL